MSRFLLFLFSAVAVCASSIVNASACRGNALSIQIVDDIGGGRKASIAEVSDPVFRNFLSSVLLRIERLAQGNGDCTYAEGDDSLNLLFVRQPLVQNRPSMPLPNVFSGSSLNGCRISSPWIDFEFENSAIPKVRGVIRWSQRQLLVDQAMMAGDIQIADAKVDVLRDDEFEIYAQAYVYLEILHKPEASPFGSSIPPDILWLFRNSWQSTRGPFSLGAMNAMDNLMERGAERYADLVVSLIDHCVSSGQGELRYESVLDLKGVVPIDMYKIDNLL